MNKVVSERLAAKIEATACPEAVASQASVERVDASIERLNEIKAERGKKKKPRMSLADLAREAAAPAPAVVVSAAAGGDEDPADPPSDPGASFSLADDLDQLLGGEAPSPAAAVVASTEEDFLASLISTTDD